MLHILVRCVGFYTSKRDDKTKFYAQMMLREKAQIQGDVGFNTSLVDIIKKGVSSSFVSILVYVLIDVFLCIG